MTWQGKPNDASIGIYFATLLMELFAKALKLDIWVIDLTFEVKGWPEKTCIFQICCLSSTLF